MFNDKIICELYVEFDIPCDSLVTDLKTMYTFRDRYREKTGVFFSNPEVLSKRLITLRKLGQNKGGLPRIRVNIGT